MSLARWRADSSSCPSGREFTERLSAICLLVSFNHLEQGDVLCQVARRQPPAQARQGAALRARQRVVDDDRPRRFELLFVCCDGKSGALCCLLRSLQQGWRQQHSDRRQNSTHMRSMSRKARHVAELRTCMWTAMRSLRVRSKEYTSARPPTPMRKVAGSIAVVTEELQREVCTALANCCRSQRFSQNNRYLPRHTRTGDFAYRHPALEPNSSACFE